MAPFAIEHCSPGGQSRTVTSLLSAGAICPIQRIALSSRRRLRFLARRCFRSMYFLSPRSAGLSISWMPSSSLDAKVRPCLIKFRNLRIALLTFMIAAISCLSRGSCRKCVSTPTSLATLHCLVTVFPLTRILLRASRASPCSHFAGNGRYHARLPACAPPRHIQC
jgi:hypothetical protein